MRFDAQLAGLGHLPRLAVVVALLSAGVLLGIETHLYATALVALIAGLVVSATGLRIFGSAHDIVRDHPTAESKTDYLQSMLDTVNAALIVLDETNRATLVNRAAQRFAGEPIYRLEQIPLLDAAAAQRLENMPAGQSDVIALADGQAVLVSVSEFRARGESKQRLIALQRVASDLELVQLAAWRDVMRTLSHEMMNSLTPIASLAESLHDRMQQVADDSPSSGISAPAIEAIARRSRGLLEFVQRYREVAVLPEPRIQVVDAAELLSRLERLIQPLAYRRKIAFECRLDADLKVDLDPALTEQAVMNLLLNAMDAVEPVVDPKVTLQLDAIAGGTQIKVIDNGTGVDPAHRAQLFVPFFTTKTGGSGIGLNLARNIALAHGGRLAYEPNPPQGSIFTLTIPDGTAERVRNPSADDASGQPRALV